MYTVRCRLSPNPKARRHANLKGSVTISGLGDFIVTVWILTVFLYFIYRPLPPKIVRYITHQNNRHKLHTFASYFLGTASITRVNLERETCVPIKLSFRSYPAQVCKAGCLPAILAWMASGMVCSGLMLELPSVTMMAKLGTVSRSPPEGTNTA